MSGKAWLALLCLVGGIPLAAWGLAKGVWPAAIAGLALVLGFIYLAMAAIARANEPRHKITPAADAAWNLRDLPRDPPPPGAPPAAPTDPEKRP